MDKFGIFNLINSLLTPKPSENSSSTSTDTKENSPLSSLLSGLLNSNGDKNEQNKHLPSPEVKPTPKKIAPLQSSMLNTIKNHDQLIRRVNGLNKINEYKLQK